MSDEDLEGLVRSGKTSVIDFPRITCHTGQLNVVLNMLQRHLNQSPDIMPETALFEQEIMPER